MGIKVKHSPVPDTYDGDWPAYAKDTPCWGCDRLFDCTELLAPEGLCGKCRAIVIPSICGVWSQGELRVRCGLSPRHTGLHRGEYKSRFRPSANQVVEFTRDEGPARIY